MTKKKYEKRVKKGWGEKSVKKKVMPTSKNKKSSEKVVKKVQKRWKKDKKGEKKG